MQRQRGRLALPHRLDRAIELAATFLLDVLGGAGAVWGCSECAALRGGFNGDQWRVCSAVVGLFCLVRWARLNLGWPVGRNSEVLATALLQVLGAAGAVWGGAEILGLRVKYPPNCKEPQAVLGGTFQGISSAWGPGYESCSDTYGMWRLICTFVFLLFALRWQGMLPRCMRGSSAFHLHISTFVLEVVGGAGALWGVSEVAGSSGRSLRLGWGDYLFGQESFDQWRWCCTPVFVLCLVRWLARWKSRVTGGLAVEKAEGAQRDSADLDMEDTVGTNSLNPSGLVEASTHREKAEPHQEMPPARSSFVGVKAQGGLATAPADPS